MQGFFKSGIVCFILFNECNNGFLGERKSILRDVPQKLLSKVLLKDELMMRESFHPSIFVFWQLYLWEPYMI